MQGEGTTPCAIPCSTLPSGTQAQHCRRWVCCGHAKYDRAFCSSSCRCLRALPPFFQALGAPLQQWGYASAPFPLPGRFQALALQSRSSALAPQPGAGSAMC